MAGNTAKRNQELLVEPEHTPKPAFQRVLLKLTGEALMGRQNFGMDPESMESISRQIKVIHQSGVQVAIVVGGGNIVRGASLSEAGFDRATGDYMGMLATLINALALQNSLEGSGIFTRVLSAIHMAEVAEPFIRRRAIRHLEKGRVVIFAAGTGNPYFSTDTAAALRAMEIKAEIILKATKVDGVYDSDPAHNKKARRLNQLTYLQVLEMGLKVMDTTAISLCMDHELPILVFNLYHKDSIQDAVFGKKMGSMIRN